MDKQPKAALQWHTWAIVLSIAGISALYFMNVRAVTDGVRDGLAVCGGTLVPSLFPFMVLCSFLVQSRWIDAVSRPFAWFSMRVLRLDAPLGGVFVLSLVGGYPIGSRMLAELVRQGRASPRTAERMLCFCVNAGPAFLITAVGARMIGSAKAGVYLFAAQTAASVALAALTAFFDKKRGQNAEEPVCLRPVLPSFVTAVKGTSESMLSVCGFVTLFSAIISLADISGLAALIKRLLFFVPEPVTAAAVNGVLEVTLGCARCPDIEGGLSLLVACALCSFGGLSVMAQALFFFNGLSVSPRRYLLTRPVHMILSCSVLWLLLRLFPVSVPAFSPSSGSGIIQPIYETPAISLALFALCAALILSSREPKQA